MTGWPPHSRSRAEQDAEDHNDPRELPDADLEALADRGEDADARYRRGWEGMDPREDVA